MNNIIIGIMGIMISTGLALAGASFVGGDFMTAATTTKANAAIKAVSMLATAVNNYSIAMEATPTQAANGTFNYLTVANGFLPETPVNPVDSGRSFRVVYDRSITAVVSTNPVNTVVTSIGDARDVCIAVEKQSGNTAVPFVLPVATSANIAFSAPRATGCFQAPAAGILGAGAGPYEYVVYAKF